MAAVSLSLMFAGGKDSLSALQAASVVVALPLMVVLTMMIFSLKKWLEEDFPLEEHEKPEDVRIPIATPNQTTPGE